MPKTQKIKRTKYVLRRLPKTDNDYVFDTANHTTCWVTVGQVSIHIVSHDDGVQVKLYPLNAEMANPLDTASATHEEAKEAAERDAKGE